jgi:hypothetical protein
MSEVIRVVAMATRVRDRCRRVLRKYSILTVKKQEPAPLEQVPGQANDHGERAKHAAIMP